MKILYLAHRIPYPPNKGDKIRSFHEINHLSREHELHLLAFCDNAEDLQYAQHLENYCRSVTLVPINPFIQKLKAGISILAGRPFSLGYFDSTRMKRAIQRELANHRFDLIFVYCSSMAPYVEAIRGIPKILDFVDSDACKWAQYAAVRKGPMRWTYGLEAERLKRYETQMIEEFDFSVFVSPREADHLSRRQQNRVLFIQNGIDLDYYRPERRSHASRDIIFTGVMDYFPNVDAVTYFAHEIFPSLRQRFPDARFVIVGSNPVPAVRKLAALPGVVVTGTVPDVRHFIAQSRVAVAPLRISQGIQNKILQALAGGLPVVASPNAVAGLPHLTRAPLTIAENSQAFIAAVGEYLSRPMLSQAEVRSCHHALKQHHDWAKNLNAFQAAMNAVTPRLQRSRGHVEGVVAAGVGSSL
jgi:sugar transferase (PEP-CTERM/EpsH1 system associated)